MKTKVESKNEQVYHHLRTMILEGELAPGERVVIGKNAARSGISPIPVREALSRLEAEGFVTLEPHVGARVSELEIEEVQEVFELLEALEVSCARAACLKLNDLDLAWTESLIEEMDRASYDPELWARRNRELHLFIAERSGKKLLLRLLRSLFDHWDRLRRYYLSEVFTKRIPAAEVEHGDILAAFQERNPEALEAIISRHNRAALDAYQAHLLEETK